jgi:hypothetical protein
VVADRRAPSARCAYNLTWALARAGSVADATRTLAAAIELNPDLAAHASRDPDLVIVNREP